MKVFHLFRSFCSFSSLTTRLELLIDTFSSLTYIGRFEIVSTMPCTCHVVFASVVHLSSRYSSISSSLISTRILSSMALVAQLMLQDLRTVHMAL